MEQLSDSYWVEFWSSYGKIFLRYSATATTAFLLFYVLFRRWSARHRIQLRFPKRKDYLREVGFSIASVGMFAVMAVLIFHSPLTPYSKVYFDFGAHSTAYYAFTFVAMVFVHDAYFYWAHRLMHHRRLYRHVHRVHHLSTNPSPWAAYAFHPLEAFIEAAILPIMAFSFPIHYSAFGFFFLFQILYNVYGHLGYELYPKGFNKHWLGRWINTSTHHNLHHKHFKGSYGLYFTLWDRLMGTMAERYDDTYAAVDEQRRKAKSPSGHGKPEMVPQHADG
jgi:sterol desaturase/sphingolipid hydroxylase (fatty acid hydroxylase superfamily)